MPRLPRGILKGWRVGGSSLLYVTHNGMMGIGNRYPSSFFVAACFCLLAGYGWVSCAGGLTVCGEQAGCEVASVDAVERAQDIVAVVAVVPEEVFALCQFFFWPDGGEYLFAGVGMLAGVGYFGCHGHRCGREVLHLFKVEVEVLCLDGELCHVFFVAAGMA